MRLVLASASPRRRALIALLGLDARAAPTDIDEDAHLTTAPLVAALNVAAAKLDAAAPVAEDEVMLTADTLVVSDGAVLGKPADADAALAILRSLRGRGHDVITGIALRDGIGRQWGGVVSTRVTMRDYSDSEIAAYIARGEPFDKAGGYAIQDERFHPVAAIEGCFLNVVGLPLCAAAAGLRALGTNVATAEPPPCDYCRRGKRAVSIT